MKKRSKHTSGQICMIAGGLLLLVGESIMPVAFYDGVLAFALASVDVQSMYYLRVRMFYEGMFAAYPLVMSFFIGLQTLGVALLAWGAWAYFRGQRGH